jgi:hypothetical protein
MNLTRQTTELALRAAPPLAPADRAVRTRRSRAAVDKGVALPDHLRMQRVSAKVKTLQALRIKNAAGHLRELPPPGHSLHCVMKGNYNAWDLVPAVLRLAAPAVIDHLDVATLGFNKQNAIQLVTLLDEGRIGSCTFIASTMYWDQERAVCNQLAAALESRPPSRFSALRNHAKVILFTMSDGARYVIEGSANLRSCRNVEQFCLLNDSHVHTFHHQWISDLAKANPYDPNAPPPPPKKPT